jgi:uncharacterized MAPEG superfamily protein
MRGPKRQCTKAKNGQSDSALQQLIGVTGERRRGIPPAMLTTFPPILQALTWGCILALVHLFAAVNAKTRQYGAEWNIGARDEDLPPLNPIAGRLARAQANFFETFPIFIAAVILAGATGAVMNGNSTVTLGGWLWLGGRVAYLPLYAFGIPVVRSLAWAASLVGIVLVIMPALKSLF